jgi:hypothetical protein
LLNEVTAVYEMESRAHAKQVADENSLIAVIVAQAMNLKKKERVKVVSRDAWLSARRERLTAKFRFGSRAPVQWFDVIGRFQSVPDLGSPSASGWSWLNRTGHGPLLGAIHSANRRTTRALAEPTAAAKVTRGSCPVAACGSSGY